jgi:hypothetical protein
VAAGVSVAALASAGAGASRQSAAMALADPFADTILEVPAPGVMLSTGVVYVRAERLAQFQSPLPPRIVTCQEPWLSFENRRVQRGEWWDRA